MTNLNDVKEFWDKASCGEVYATGSDWKEKYDAQKISRYVLEPYVRDFAKFDESTGKDILEIGVGMGADHEEFALAHPASLRGIDLTDKAIEHCKKKFQILGLSSLLEPGNAESLDFQSDSFDVVYSCGVIHHSPNTEEAVREIYRVLRQGGVARVMIYHRYSPVGFLLWTRYALLKGRPWLGLNHIYDEYLESPGTKAYTVSEAKKMFSQFSSADMSVICSSGDLLYGEAGQRHRGILLSLAKKLWPRSVVKWISKRFNFGLYLLIEAKK